MLAQGIIDVESVGIALPLVASPGSQGSLTFGEGEYQITLEARSLRLICLIVVTSQFIGNLTYTASSEDSWYISQNISYDGTTFLSGSGIVDTGTILVYLAAGEFEAYMAATGGTYESAHNLVSFTPEQ